MRELGAAGDVRDVPPAGAEAEPATDAAVEACVDGVDTPVEAGDEADPDDELMTVDAVAAPAAAGADPPEQAARGAATPRRSAPHSGIAAGRRCRLLMCAAFSTDSPEPGEAVLRPGSPSSVPVMSQVMHIADM